MLNGKRILVTGDGVLNLAATVKLLKRTRLMMEDQDYGAKEELLR